MRFEFGFILLLVLLTQSCALEEIDLQTNLDVQINDTNSQDGNNFQLSYWITGMGSNTGSAQAIFVIDGLNYHYINYNENYWSVEEIIYDTISSGVIKKDDQSYLISQLNELGDTTIYDTNVGILSGGIVTITMSNFKHSTKVTMHNAFHQTVFEIGTLLNQYIPNGERKLWTFEYLRAN